MMKVLHVVNSLEIGGAQRLLSEILPLMKSRHIDISLLVIRDVESSFSEKIKNSGVDLFSLKCNSFYSPMIFFYLIPYLRKADIVHVHLFPSLYWVSFANIITGTKLFFTEHSTNNRRRSKWYLSFIEKSVYSRYNKVISISNQAQSNLITWLGVNGSNQRFVCINNGVSISDYANSIMSKKLLVASGGCRIILMISRFSPQKDHETVIRSISHIPHNNIMFAFAGDGPTLDICKKKAIKLGVFNKILFLGNVDNIPALINSSYIGIQSSFWEGFGLTAAEFMAGKRPIVASNVDGLKQVVEGAGLLFPAGDEIKLAECICELLDNQKFYSEISKKCFERVQNYDIEIMIDKYIDEYEKM